MAKLNLNAKDALAELKALIIEVQKLKTEVTSIKGSSSQSFRDLENSTSRLKTKIGELNNRMNYLVAIIKKQENEINSLTAATNKNTNSNNKNSDSLKKQEKSSKSLWKSFKNLISVFGIIGGLSLFRNILVESYEAIKTFDSLGFALERITQTTEDYESSSRFLLQLTKDFGVELVSTTNRWIKFLAAAKNAGLSLSDTENIFRSMTKAAGVLGLKTDELQGIYLALEQMLSKGKVTTEELRRQLGERLPGAMGIMAASIGVTIPKLDEMLRKGEVLSADVLPKFADAVEIAFGIENVEKIDTIVAAENRAIASWQNFIKIIGNSEGIINKSLRSILGGFTVLSDSITNLISPDSEKINKAIGEFEKEYSKSLKRSAKNRLSEIEEYNGLEVKLKEDIEKTKVAITRTSNKEERKLLNDHLDKISSDLILYNQKVKETEKNIAEERFDGALKRYEKTRDRFAEINEEFEKVKNGELIGKTKFNQKLKDQAEFNFIEASALYNLYRKLIEDSEVQLPEDKDNGPGKKPRIVYLENILDLEKQIQIQIAKTNIERNKSDINSDTVGFEDKIKLIKENNNLVNRIAKLQYNIELEKYKEYQSKKQDQLKKDIAKGAIIIGDQEKYLLDLQKEYDEKAIIADKKKNQTIVKNNESSSKEMMKIIDDINKQSLNFVKDPFNVEIAAIKKGYELSKKTNKDKQILEKELKRVAIESANAQIDAQISLLKAQIATGDNSQDTINALILKINELEAAKQNFIQNNEGEADTIEFWETILDLASEYNKAVADLVDAAYNRRIENINAEIEAEKKKYDTLISLAEGEDAQQASLEISKQERIEALEKKRLKEEQKQARARKAFAIADIAISTAQAIMRAYSDTGPIAGNVFAAIIGALGAVQVAAVLAQPIPQYKDGGEIKKNELAMINDGIAQEYVERNGNILTTKTKDALVDLKAGDVVYKNYDDMINKSLLIPNGIKEINLSESKFNDMFGRFEDSIEKGFKKAKINITNNIPIQKQERELVKTSRWK